jgi:hypothetical protein
MESSVSILDMHNFVENIDSGIQISNDIGNVVSIGSEDLGDDFGASLLSNRVSARPAPNTFSSSVPSLDPIQDIGISSMEPLEAISFDIPSSSSSLPDISVTRNDNTSKLFENEQSATGPSIFLASPQRISPEEERKKKTELINKLNRLESKGYTLTKRFTMDNSLEEIQQEYDRLFDAKSLEASLRFQRQCLMGVVTGAEFLNGKFNPFDWELDGWSESVHENIEDFDEVFEELYDKYKGRGNMPPEAKLMMSLVGSGFMFHMSNSFFRSKMSAMNPNDIFRNNPQLAKQFAAAAAQQAGPGFGNFMGAAMGVPTPSSAPPSSAPSMQPNTGPFYQASNIMTPQSIAATAPSSGPRREMRGPSGVDDILKTFQEVRSAELDLNPISLSIPQNMEQPVIQAMSEISSHASTPRSDMSSLTGRFSQVGSTARGGRARRRATAPVENTVTLNL